MFSFMTTFRLLLKILQLRFIRAYLSEERSNADVIKHHEATDEEEEAMLLEANVYALASHFLWGLWAIVQSHISSIEFGYLVSTAFILIHLE